MLLKLSYDEEFVKILESIGSRLGVNLLELEGIGSQLDINENAKKYMKNSGPTADVSVDANANVETKDVVGYQYELPKPLFKLNSLYLLWEQLKKNKGSAFAKLVIESQLRGDIYINDSSDIGRPYCFNYSTYDIALEGLPMIQKIKSTAPKSLFAFKSQVEQFIVIASNSTLGATGLADILLCMGMYVERCRDNGYLDGHIQLEKSEDALEDYVDETITSLIYTLNQPMRGNQSPFTNISLFDLSFLRNLCPDYSLPGRPPVSPETVVWLQNIFMSIMNREMRRTPITFPVTTACFAVDDRGDIQDTTFVDQVSMASQEWGFINFYCGKTSTLSSCCRLRSETDNEYFNSFGAGSTKIGSLGVVTLPLPVYAEMASDWPSFLRLVEIHAGIACEINNAKRVILASRISSGNMPLYTHGHMDLKKQYSTIGITGMHEALGYQGFDVREDIDKAVELISVLNEVADSYAKLYNAPHNLEQVPAESSAVKLADKAYTMGLNTNEDGTQRFPFYSNQFIPHDSGVDLLERIGIQGALDQYFSGGSIMHANVGTRVSCWTSIRDLILYCAKSGVVYWAVNYLLGECEKGHMSVSGGSSCDCGAPIVSTYTRVVGFLTKTSAWNKVRRTVDLPTRTRYNLEESV